MDVKTASAEFGITENEVRDLGKLGLSGIRKVSRKWVVPDDTKVLLSLNNIRVFLYNVLKFKNNDGYVFPRRFCPTKEILVAVINQQYENGFIGAKVRDESASDEDILKDIKLTDDALKLILGGSQDSKLTTSTMTMSPIIIKAAPTINILSPNASVI